MKIIKCQYKNKINFGIIKENVIFISKESPYLVNNFFETVDLSKPINLNEVKILLPYEPSKIIGVAINYNKASNSHENMEEPLFFLKGINTLSLNNEKIKIPFNLPCWGEVELAIIISKRCKMVKKGEYSNYVLGYTVVNDITTENIEGRDHHLARSKSADGFCPILNYIDTDFIPSTQKLQSFHNGELLREGNVSDMIWSAEKIIMEITKWMTLEKGDIILTGTPSRVGPRKFLKSKDKYRCEIEGFEKLENIFYE